MSETAKRQAALGAIEMIPEGSVVGVGTGSTVAYFIEALATLNPPIEGAVASSLQTEKALKAHGIVCYEPHMVSIPCYVDGADEVTHHFQMIKGGGAAMVRERIVAAYADQFICIVDESKVKPVLGDFPIAIEVIPMARSLVGRELVKLGGNPEYREGVITDNGNVIIDCHDLTISEPIQLSKTLNNLPGVVGHGLFADQMADVVLVGSATGCTPLVKAPHR